jgi:Mg/Co/Ni transporter MgtE
LEHTRFDAGAQSLAAVERGIVMREIPRRIILPLIRREAQPGAIEGGVTAMVAVVGYDNFYPGLVIGLDMLLNLFLPAWRERPCHCGCGTSASMRPRARILS